MAHPCPRPDPGRRSPVGRWVVCLVLVTVSGFAGDPTPAAAQHPLGARTRPFHQRIRWADAVVVVRVDAVETGRIRVSRRATLSGSVPAQFEIKRAPSRPPPLAAQDLAVVLLRGASPPYVLLDEPRETILLPDAATEERWIPALRRAIAEPTRGEALLPLYLAWIDEGPETLREAALDGLLDPDIDTPALRQRLAADRAAAAADPERAASARRISAILAVRTPMGTASLLPQVARQRAEASVVAAALGGGAMHRSRGTGEALERALVHDDAAVRRAALQALPAVSRAFGTAPMERIEEMARSDADPNVRRRAARLISTLAAATPSLPAGK